MKYTLNSLFHGADALRILYAPNCSRTCPLFVESELSLPSVIVPYPEPAESALTLTTILILSSRQLLPQNFLVISGFLTFFMYLCSVFPPTPFFLSSSLNNVWWSFQTMELLIISFSQFYSCCLSSVQTCLLSSLALAEASTCPPLDSAWL